MRSKQCPISNSGDKISKKPIILQKHKCIALGEVHMNVSQSPNKKGLNLTFEVDVVDYKQLEDQQTQIMCRMMDGHEDTKRMAHDWKEKVKTYSKLKAYCNHLLGMIIEI